MSLAVQWPGIDDERSKKPVFMGQMFHLFKILFIN